MNTFNAAVRMGIRFLSLIAIPIALSMTARAQTPTPTPMPQASPTAAQTAPTIPAADPKDVATMDSIVAAVYDVISGPAGKRNVADGRPFFAGGTRPAHPADLQNI